MTDRNDPASTPSATRAPKVNRRQFLRGAAATAAVASVAAPAIWIPNTAIAQTAGRESYKHLLYVRLSGGFRFTTAFNGAVASEFNPWGTAATTADGTEWGVSDLLSRSSWLTQDLRDSGMKSVNQLSNEICVMPCVDHEPFSGSADGNHTTGLQRFYTGYVGPGTSVLTMINYGLRDRVAQANLDGRTILPAVSLGDAGMAAGFGDFAAYRPAVIRGTDFSDFGFNSADALPEWAADMAIHQDERMRDRQNPTLQDTVDAYIESRHATRQYADIFGSDTLNIRNNSEEPIDGLSNQRLAQIFGDNNTGRNVRLALRLFHFGSPAVYLNQGGYDFHSGEENGLPPRMEELNRMISGLEFALKTMSHPEGGSYWDHTLVAFGSEFGRTTRGGRFNSARGSDHGGDLATRWMSMPIMGGAVSAVNGGRQLGETRATDLVANDKVYSYRSLMKTFMDGLGCDHQGFFPEDRPFDDLFV